MRADAASLLRQVGFAPGAPDPRFTWGAVLAILAIYTVSFFAFYPQLATNDDEARYIRQARLMLEGTTTATWEDPLTGEILKKQPSKYPVGTAALIAPFLWAFGEPGAWLPPFLSLLVAVVCTARWLADDGRSPLYSLLVLGFPAVIVLGRVSISDAPSMAIVALGLWLFWRGLDRGPGWWLAAGFAAGGSIFFRETNAIAFVALFAGTVLRRDRGWWALVVGGLAGISLRVVSNFLAYGDWLYARGAGPLGFGLHAIPDNALLHFLALFVFMPGGLVFAYAYRGRRRPEILVTVTLFVLVYLFHWFGPPASGFVKRLVVELRYFAPLLPILAFATAESAPRLWRRLVEGSPRRRVLETVAACALVAWIAGLAAASGLVHFALYRWAEAQATIREEIDSHTGDGVLVTNWPATKKFTRELDRRYYPVTRLGMKPGDAMTLHERHGDFYIAFLDRSDSEIWREDTLANDAFVASLEPPPELLLDHQVTATDRLRIWHVTELVRERAE